MWGWVITAIVGLALIEHLVSLFDDIGEDVVVFQNEEELQAMCMGGLRHEGKQYD